MTFFSLTDHAAVKNSTAANLTHDVNLVDAYEKLHFVHRKLTAQIRTNHYDLHAVESEPISFNSAATRAEGGTMAIQYFRPTAQASIVERLMGRSLEEIEKPDPRHHPVIEVRLTPKNLVVELIVSANSWWDQQNLAGKITIERHRYQMYKMLQTLPGNYRMGFWQGTELSSMHLEADLFRYRKILDEWLPTFEAGKDWFRVGVWYEPDTLALEEENIINELFAQFKLLYRLYETVLWTSDNNFRNFTKKKARTVY